MAQLRLEDVTKRFGRVEAVRDINLEIHDGEFFCVLGPPSSGKTTVLRLIVGLERPDGGTVYIDGTPVNTMHPRHRDIAMIFQNLALYPDKSVFDNIAFPLYERRVPKHEIRERVRAVAQTLRIHHLLDRKPGKLSGGERQRVAIGRAIVRRPQAYLMDEPLANLDALLRSEMRVELKRLQQDLGQTMVYVTSDQVEAMSMADRVAVLNQGVLQQCDTPLTVYRRPANRFVAALIGSPSMNFLVCGLQEAENGLLLTHQAFTLHAVGGDHPLRRALAQLRNHQDRAIVGIRPEDLHVSDGKRSAQAIPARVSVIEPLGSESIVDTYLGSDIVRAIVPPTQKFNEGEPVWLQFDPSKIHVFDSESGLRIFTSGKAGTLECTSSI